MYVGIPNPNIIVPLAKMTMKAENGKEFQVLYNPDSVVRTRQTQYSDVESLGGVVVSSQFAKVGLEQLSFRLFFDSTSSGSEVGGTIADKALFASNSMQITAAKALDVRDYMWKVSMLMLVDDDLHAPPVVRISWGSLQFDGYLINCKQEFVKFNELGMPIRAWLDCTFQETASPLIKSGKIKSLNSPDTTKFHTVCQGESLWSMSVAAYGQPEQWRLIADANDIDNPRRLRSGEILRMPALKK